MTINCYGDVGPWRLRPGWEQLSQSVTGIASAQGEPGKPQLVAAAAADYTTGYLAALGTMAALRRRAIEGGSYHVRASLCQTAMWIAEDGPCIDPSAASGLGDQHQWMTDDSDAVRSAHAHDARRPTQQDTGPMGPPPVPLGTHEPAW